MAADDLGQRFTQEFRAAGVAYNTPPRPGSPRHRALPDRGDA
ncbi:MAG: hypothetical protein R3C16_04995 [Hyphomonadaceae bacterium]